ncbi:MAG: tRNA (adenosine(37)-N6)-threonylcarbamoyltransferase complex dimerization subunit type 1 TsaB [Actinobacteria bacterium]|nr:tRNA (adenosine(37)-N6)-threonylcarbamoyltransferase complex dimerization subunit type 1 TsaB [Actinomycetota bacterium]
MIVLGIETSTAQVACALGGAEGVMAAFESGPGVPLPGRNRATPRHAELLAPAIEFICQQARVDLKDVGVVAVDLGPGMFTGVRVGVATGKALAQALRIPMVGLGSLDLLAFPVRYADRTVAAVLDARRDEVYFALYRPVPAGVQRVGETRVCSPDELYAELLAHGEDVLAVGDGAVRYRETLRRLDGVEIDVVHPFPSAASLVTLAHARAVREEFVQPWEINPVYLRPAVGERAAS